MQRYINNSKRLWWLLLVPILVAPSIMALTIRPDSIYTVRASFQIEHSIYYDTSKSLQLDFLGSAADNNIALLTSLLYSPSFLQDVITNIDTASFSLQPQLNFLLNGKIAGSFKILAGGDSLIIVSYTGSNLDYDKAVTQSVIDTYNNFIVNILKTRGSQILDYLTTQVAGVKVEADTVDQQVNQYLNDNPSKNTSDLLNQISFLSSKDLTTDILLKSQTDIHSRYDTLKGDLQQLQISYSNIQSGQSSFVTIKDKPALLTSSVYNKTYLMIQGALLGLVGGILLALTFLIVITRTDLTLHDEEFARNYLGVQFALSLPQVGNLKPPKEPFLKTTKAEWNSLYPAKTQRRRNLRRTGLILLVLFSLILFTVQQSRYLPPNAIVVPAISLLIVLIYYWPVTGYFLTLFLILVSESFQVPDFISPFTTIPMQNINMFTSIPLSATPEEMILFVTIVSILFKAVPRGEHVLDRSKTALLVTVLGAFLIFGLFYGVFLTHGDLKAAEWEIRGLVYIVIIYFLTMYFMRDIRYWKVVNWLIPIGIEVMSAIVIWRAFIIPTQTTSNLFVESLSGYNHDTAIFLVIGVMWCLIKFLFGGSAKEKLVALMLIFPAGIGIMVSGRRAAFASLAVCFILCLAMMFLRRRKAFIFTVIILAIIVPPYMVLFRNAPGPLGLAARALSSSSAEVGSRDYSSDLYRVIEKSNVQLTIKQSPLTGIGFGQAFTRYNALPDLDNFTFQYITPHVQVLWIWLKLGMFGWIIFWLLICGGLFRLGQLVKYDRNGLRLNLGILSGCILGAIMIYAYVDVSMTDQRLTFLLALSIGLLEIGYRSLKISALRETSNEIIQPTQDNEVVILIQV